MVKDKRKALRRTLRYSAWVALEGDQLYGCVLSDVSDTGARIETDDSKIIPADFTLLLASNGAARRLCHVVWRNERQIGVTFERRPADTEKATLVPKPGAATDVAPPVAAATANATTETVMVDGEQAT
jgi:hypothetical protein